jgi:hypothetical protein
MIRRSIICNSCYCVGWQETGMGIRQFHQLRAALKKLGWLHIEKCGKDFCPLCQKENKHKQ